MVSNKRILLFLIVILVILGFGSWLIFGLPHKNSLPESNLSITMKILSTAFQNNNLIPAKYTCDGKNINPPLQIIDVPENSKSLALIMDDPDSPIGTWLHWSLWNIDPQTKIIKENSVPQNARQGITNFGHIGYGGPCPGSGLHHYHFKLYALSAIPDLSEGATLGELQNFINSHTIAAADLVGLYSRQ